MTPCGKYPCSGTTAGCSDQTCINYRNPMMFSVPIGGTPYQPPQMGCICPPTSEQTCEGPLCPRKPPRGYVAAQTALNPVIR